MAELAIAAAGAFIGNAAITVPILGMSGTAIGWMAGSMIANAFAPAQKTFGPKLSDLNTNSSVYGTPIPFVQGSPRIAGQIIWASTKREIATTTKSGGKGGRKAKHTSYTYVVDLLILLTDNEIPGVSRIWNNGKLIWNHLATADATTIAASTASNAWSSISVYTGAANQMPDPIYEAAVGTEAVAYRGRGTVMIGSLELGSSGIIPNLTFEIGPALDSLVLFQLLFTAGSTTDIAQYSIVRTGQSGAITPTDGNLRITQSTSFSYIYWQDNRFQKAGNANGWTLEVMFKISSSPSKYPPVGEKFMQFNTGGVDILFTAGTGFLEWRFGSSVFSTESIFDDSSKVHHFSAVVRPDNLNVVDVYLNGHRFGQNLTFPTGSNATVQLGSLGASGQTTVIDFVGVRIIGVMAYLDVDIFTPPSSPAAWGIP